MVSTEMEVRHAVCFSLQKRKYIHKLSEKHQGVEIKKVKLGLGTDIILRDDATIHGKELDFKPVEETFDETSLTEILYSQEIFECVHVKVKLVNFDEIEEKDTANGLLILSVVTALDSKEEIK